MPVIKIDGPKVTDLEKKRAFVKTVTAAAAEFYGIPEQAFVILLRETTPENVSVGGTLLVDRRA